MLTALAFWLYFFQEANWGLSRDYRFHGLMPVVPTVLASALALVVVSLITKPPAPEVVARFFPERVGDR